MARDSEHDLGQVMKQSEDLLDQLDAIGGEGNEPSHKETAKDRQRQDPILSNNSDSSQVASSNALAVLGWLFAGVFIVIIGAVTQNQTAH